MQKRFFLFTGLVALLLIFNASCSKDDNPPDTSKTKTELITSASWKFDKATTASIGDISSFIDACFKDNTITFAVNKTGNVNEGTLVCTPSYAGNFTWEFQTNETILHLSAAIFTGGSTDFTLVSLNETNLVISQVMTIAPYPATTVEVTFKH